MRGLSPPPAPPLVKRVQQNLLGSPVDAAITLVLVGAGLHVAWSFVDWAIIDAVWLGTRGSDCAASDGACWAFIAARWDQIIYGQYPAAERWRVDLCFAGGALALALLLQPRARQHALNIAILVVYPPVCWLLLRGGYHGLATVTTDRWGGLMLTLVVAVTAIMVSIPLGLALALGRRSKLPVLQALCAGFIEFWRGVPLLAVLFVASVMFPLFTPPGFEANLLLRVLIAFSLFKAAYVAEVFRGGLQIVPRGQTEAAQALGLWRWRILRSIILPQVMRSVRPALINVYILTVKETTIVMVIGLADLTGVVQLGLSDSTWLGSGDIATTAYVFIAIVFWCLTFTISRWGAYRERQDNRILRTPVSTHGTLPLG